MSNRDVGVEHYLRELAEFMISRAKEEGGYSALAETSVEELVEALRDTVLPGFGLKIRKDRN